MLKIITSSEKITRTTVLFYIIYSANRFFKSRKKLMTMYHSILNKYISYVQDFKKNLKNCIIKCQIFLLKLIPK